MSLLHLNVSSMWNDDYIGVLEALFGILYPVQSSVEALSKDDDDDDPDNPMAYQNDNERTIRNCIKTAWNKFTEDPYNRLLSSSSNSVKVEDDFNHKIFVTTTFGF